MALELSELARKEIITSKSKIIDMRKALYDKLKRANKKVAGFPSSIGGVDTMFFDKKHTGPPAFEVVNLVVCMHARWVRLMHDIFSRKHASRGTGHTSVIVIPQIFQTRSDREGLVLVLRARSICMVRNSCGKFGIYENNIVGCVRCHIYMYYNLLYTTKFENICLRTVCLIS